MKDKRERKIKPEFKRGMWVCCNYPMGQSTKEHRKKNLLWCPYCHSTVKMTPKTKKPDWEKEFEKLLISFNKDMLDAALMFDESGWTDKLLDFINKEIKATKREVLEDLEKDVQCMDDLSLIENKQQELEE